MSQKNNIVNFVIHDANGQPQMVKVVQNTPKQSLPHIKLKPNSIKVLKIPTTEEPTQTPVYRTVKGAGVKRASKVIQDSVDPQTPLQKPTVEIKTETPAYAESEEVELPDLVLIPDKRSSYSQPSSSKANTSSSSISSKSMSHTSRKRHEPDEPVPEYTTKRRKHADKVGKGLRHFSMKVCEKVRNKGFTSYNEVADELVAEFTAGLHGSSESQPYDQKNIRRRVYDALNVLMAMNIISKDKKEIRWLGLPTNSIQECTTLEKEKQAKLERIQEKTQQLQELILQHISYKSLIERNKEAEAKGLKPSPSSAISLPFIVVNTESDAIINCSISTDKTEYMFTFDKTFQIHDDNDILKRMGLLGGLDKRDCTEEEIERAKKLVPSSLVHFVEQMGRGVSTKISDLLGDDDTLDDEEFEEEEGGGEAEGVEDEQEYTDGSSE